MWFSFLYLDNFIKFRALRMDSLCKLVNSSVEKRVSTDFRFRKSFRPNAIRKMRRRAVFKNGDCNILQSRISKRRLRYLQDIFTTLVDSQWRWTLTIFAIGFVGKYSNTEYIPIIIGLWYFWILPLLLQLFTKFG